MPLSISPSSSPSRGGQSGMISAATMLCGIFQILIGPAELCRLLRFVSRAAMTGFVNALLAMSKQTLIPAFCLLLVF